MVLYLSPSVCAARHVELVGCLWHGGCITTPSSLPSEGSRLCLLVYKICALPVNRFSLESQI